MGYQLTNQDIGRLLDKIKKDSDCWLWTGKPANTGYGQIGFGRGEARKMRSAHKAVYELLVGEVPEGLDLDHLCRNRLCVNPQHLEPVTRQVNLLRGDTIPAKNAAKTHCINGHEFTEENTYRYGSNQRMCVTCRNVRKKQNRQKIKEIV